MQDTRYGRAVLAETYDVPDMAQAVTRYVARRMVERERALADDVGGDVAQTVLRSQRRRRRWQAIRAFVYGLVVGVAALFALALLNNPGQ